jgi:hypothetical protein
LYLIITIPEPPLPLVEQFKLFEPPDPPPVFAIALAEGPPGAGEVPACDLPPVPAVPEPVVPGLPPPAPPPALVTGDPVIELATPLPPFPPTCGPPGLVPAAPAPPPPAEPPALYGPPPGFP